VIRFSNLFEKKYVVPTEIHSVRESDHGDHQIEKNLGSRSENWNRITDAGKNISVGAEGPEGYHGGRHTKNYDEESWPKAVSYGGRIYHQGRARNQKDISHIDMIEHIQAKHGLSDADVDKHIDSGAMKIGVWNREGHEFTESGRPSGRTHDDNKFFLDMNSDSMYHRGKSIW
jgi:hypothetical protein